MTRLGTMAPNESGSVDDRNAWLDFFDFFPRPESAHSSAPIRLARLGRSNVGQWKRKQTTRRHWSLWGDTNVCSSQCVSEMRAQPEPEQKVGKSAVRPMGKTRNGPGEGSVGGDLEKAMAISYGSVVTCEYRREARLHAARKFVVQHTLNLTASSGRDLIFRLVRLGSRVKRRQTVFPALVSSRGSGSAARSGIDEVADVPVRSLVLGVLEDRRRRSVGRD